MDHLEKTILQNARGEHRLDPDQQRYYLGTFRERVVLTISFDDIISKQVQEAFPAILGDLKGQYDELAIKLSAKMDSSLQVGYMKQAQSAHIPATCVEEVNSQSPYALLIHSDKAEAVEHTDIKDRFPDYFKVTTSQTHPKQSFWSKLFGGKHD